ncbi:MAG: asparagine--tRNA ligase [Erysipelotrichales bacterium]|nr:asparagine--tRNA ligase [Erysipelotrichales bacterium]
MRLSLSILTKDYQTYAGKKVVIRGWIRTNRDQKEFGFISLNDGTTLANTQVVYELKKLKNYAEVSHFRVGSSIFVEGTLIETPNAKQSFEINAEKILLIGDSPEDYPIQPKRHTREFLREKGHLRVRTNLFQAVFKIRSITAFALHKFFQDQNFTYVHTPIVTANDAEGAGEMFQVSTLNPDKLPKVDGKIDYKKDFFGKKTGLTVSGQLEAEAFAFGFRDVYTFGPTFRAENSNTLRHASEFWMIEPEICFADLNDDMDLAEAMLVSVVKYVLEHAKEEIDFLNQFVDQTLKAKLEKVVSKPFKRITHKEAIDILLKCGVKFENKPDYNNDLNTEHEKYLTEKHFDLPVFVTDWPKDIKAFYMRENDDGKTVAAMDLLVPGSGELIGGSQREERIDRLVKRMEEKGIKAEGLEWYLDLRRYGGCPHAGFGIGFERLVMYLTGIENIRDVIPFPRTPKTCDI